MIKVEALLELVDLARQRHRIRHLRSRSDAT